MKMGQVGHVVTTVQRLDVDARLVRFLPLGTGWGKPEDGLTRLDLMMLCYLQNGGYQIPDT